MQTDSTILTRKNIWDIDERLLCSVCGTCLNLEEQKSILKKFVKDKKDYSDYHIHIFMINNAKNINKVSLHLQKILDKKYSKEIEAYTKFRDKDFRQLWNERFNIYDVCGLYWVAVTSPVLSEQLVIEFYQDIHMLSHLNGGEVRKERASINRLARDKKFLKKTLKEQNNDNKRLMDENRECRQMIMELEAKIKAYAGHHYLKEENEKLGSRLSSCEKEIKQAGEEIYNLKQVNNRLEDRNAILQKELNAHKAMLSGLSCINDDLQDQPCNRKQCRSISCDRDAALKKVLMVGGLTRLKGNYAQCLSERGLEMVYHDGCMNNGENKLKEMVKSCDFVLCPVDINSHNACLSTKKMCKSLNKKCFFLNNSSLSSIERALDVAFYRKQTEKGDH